MRIASDTIGNNWTRSISFIPSNFLSDCTPVLHIDIQIFILKIFTHLKELQEYYIKYLFAIPLDSPVVTFCLI